MKTFVKGLRRPGGKTVEVDLSTIKGDFRESDFLFSETPGAGVYTHTLDLPAGSTVYNVKGYVLACSDDGNYGWAAEAEFQASDGAQNYFSSGQDLHGTFYNKFDPLTFNDDVQSSYFDFQQGDTNIEPTGPSSYGPGLYYAEPTTLTMTVTATTEAEDGGVLLVRVQWSPPKTAPEASKA